jgi:hypothetical protein
VAAVALGSPAQAVAHGTPVPEGRYRFAVKLTMTGIPAPDGSTYDSACTGALIARRWVITAGHCFHDVDRNPVSGPVPYQTTATIGRTDDADTGGYVLPVVEVQQSPVNDIAILRLARPVRGIRPLAIATREPRVGQFLRLTGWGSLDLTPVPATHLQTGQVVISSVAETTLGVRGYAPEPDTSACLYDSGAPYFLRRHGRYVLVAVENDGPDCPHALEETTARVDILTSWLGEYLS